MPKRAILSSDHSPLREEVSWLLWTSLLPTRFPISSVFPSSSFLPRYRNFVARFMREVFAQMCFLISGENNVRFTFSVQFKESDIAWASRWDTYLHMSDVQIHWFAICNSVAIVLFFTGVFGLLGFVQLFVGIRAIVTCGNCVTTVVLRVMWGKLAVSLCL